MATKSSSKNKKASAKTANRSASRTANAPAKKNTANCCDCTVKECLEQHPVLRFHAVILGVLSIIICLLVAILLLSLS